MNINLIRIRSALHEQNNELLQNNTNYIEDINNDLIDEDIIIKEKADDSIMDLVFVESGGSEIIFKKIANQLREPIVLLSNGKNNSFAASLEIKTYCALNHKLCFFLTGEPHQVGEAIKHISSIVNAANSVKDTNLGVIGKPSDWLISYKKDNKKFYETFGINLIDIEMEEFFHEIDKWELVNDIPHFNKLNEKYQDKETLMGALYIYSAIKRLVIKYNLKGLTVRCFDLLERYKNTSCLALALLNKDGKPLYLYHGTNGQFNTFDKSYIGMASGDNGFFGKGQCAHCEAANHQCNSGRNSYKLPDTSFPMFSSIVRGLFCLLDEFIIYISNSVRKLLFIHSSIPSLSK